MRRKRSTNLKHCEVESTRTVVSVELDDEGRSKVPLYDHDADEHLRTIVQS